MAARLREESSSNSDWSVWERAIVPPETVGFSFKRRRNQVALNCSSIKDAFADQTEHCGIHMNGQLDCPDGQHNTWKHMRGEARVVKERNT